MSLRVIFSHGAISRALISSRLPQSRRDECTASLNLTFCRTIHYRCRLRTMIPYEMALGISRQRPKVFIRSRKHRGRYKVTPPLLCVCRRMMRASKVCVRNYHKSLASPLSTRSCVCSKGDMALTTTCSRCNRRTVLRCPHGCRSKRK